MEKFLCSLCFSLIIIFVCEFGDFLISKAEKKKPVRFWLDILLKTTMAFSMCGIWVLIFYPITLRISLVYAVINSVILLFIRLALDLVIHLILKRGEKSA